MDIGVLNWNVAGAKYFEIPKDNKKEEFRSNLNKELNKKVRNLRPDVITLQEVVEYQKPRWKDKKNIIDPPKGYYYYPCILIDNKRHPYVSKWEKVQKIGKWPKGSFLGQGNAILWRKDLKHFPIWSLPNIEVKGSKKSIVEDVILMSGLYFGDRNTEPRAALVAHFVKPVLTKKKGKKIKPLDIFVVNVHLTTLKREREGVPAGLSGGVSAHGQRVGATAQAAGHRHPGPTGGPARRRCAGPVRQGRTLSPAASYGPRRPQSDPPPEQGGGEQPVGLR